MYNKDKDSSRRGNHSENLLNLNTLRVLTASVVGLCSLAMASYARADCDGSATQTQGEGDFGYTWAICQGDNGVDDDDEKFGRSGETITIKTQGSYTAGSSLPYTSEEANQNGVIMARTRGGAGGSSSISGSQATAHIAVGVGGSGSEGGDDGKIDITFDDNNYNSINTAGYSAYGVLLQSIGGGGHSPLLISRNSVSINSPPSSRSEKLVGSRSQS